MSALHDAPQVHADDRATWRAWLDANHATSGGAWLVTWRQGSGRIGLDYEAAVEEALCFGWVDSTGGRVGSFGTTQRPSRRTLLPWTWIRTRSFGVALTAPRAGRHDSGTRRGPQVGSQRRELGVGPGGQRVFQAVIQFFRGKPAVPGGYPQQFHHLIPVRV